MSTLMRKEVRHDKKHAAQHKCVQKEMSTNVTNIAPAKEDWVTKVLVNLFNKNGY